MICRARRSVSVGDSEILGLAQDDRLYQQLWGRLGWFDGSDYVIDLSVTYGWPRQHRA